MGLQLGSEDEFDSSVSIYALLTVCVIALGLFFPAFEFALSSFVRRLLLRFLPKKDYFLSNEQLI